MSNAGIRTWIGCVALLAAAPGVAQPASAAERPMTPEQCRSIVAKFDRTIDFFRETQGERAASTLKEQLLPPQLVSELAQKDAACGVARYLRAKRLI